MPKDVRRTLSPWSCTKDVSSWYTQAGDLSPAPVGRPRGELALGLKMDGNPREDDSARVSSVDARLPLAVARRLELERLAVGAPDGLIRDVVEDAKRRLTAWKVEALDGRGRASRSAAPCAGNARPQDPGTIAEHVPPSGRDIARNGLALLAVGEFDAGYDVLVSLIANQWAQDPRGPDRRSDREVPGRGSSGPPDESGEAALCYLLLAARFLAWTGDLHRLARVWENVRDIFEAVLQTEPQPLPAEHATGSNPDFAVATQGPAAVPPVAPSALHELADAAESLGDLELTATARRRVGRVEMAGTVHDRRGGDLSPRRRKARDLPPDEAQLRWSDPAADRHAGSGHPVAAPGAAGSRGRSGFAGMDPAATLLLLVHELLGAAPDAARHRLVLRPRIPAEWDRFEARHLRVGDAAVALRYRREGARHIFCLEQERGAMPLRLVLEPLLPATTLTGARVDGRAATLETSRHGDRLVVPVQLVLDHERILELDCEATGPGDGPAGDHRDPA